MAEIEERVGFVGVGLMGHGIAKNIVEKGFPLTVIAHRNRKPVEDLLGRGAREAHSLTELAKNSTMIFLCLTSSKEVSCVIEEMRPALAPETVIVDCSTGDPTVTMHLAETLAAQKVYFADAPLSRTPKEAWEGTLDCMVGADDATFQRIQPVISTWAAKIVHIGGVADGHRMKLLNNFISLGMGALFAEALALSRKVGISVERFDSVIRGGRMDSGFYQTFMGYALEGNRNAHRFTLSNAYKDLKYLESMANDATVATPLASAVKNSYAAAVAGGGNGPEDYVPHLADFVARKNNVG
ncbi:3-hydroxyisobutyrate dehydrogenase-related protein (plasmid) [Rhizobium gallicum]|uniref:3-hydroxyisobutyrate dehydrogenase-related protein n=1 Tax=Rhizobium gallicum TaxID=56730 RepID=A0A1L5NVK5_9HYPH|nr:NAD(P)-dependent oxidoreductase [Rhizobium gallicum]APO71924.1 3-hydroxyisobutyrate dehydrogenase-related protein [Rhizobium gallicum]ULJ74728.1 NAD(P)-dependent oxidoreductase [Rhizobium gallicum]